MKKTLLSLFTLLLFASPQLKAQTVTIPDAKFAAYLNSIIPAAMSGNQMDTTSTAVTSLSRIYVENDSIGDLTGLQYFDALITIDCGNGYNALNPNYLTTLPRLPITVDSVICGRNKITILPQIPNTVTHLACYSNSLTTLPALPTTLQYLDCNSNAITSLQPLPTSLIYLDCSYNSLTGLPTLPNTLTTLTCGSNTLTTLPALPASLLNLDCNTCQLTSLPTLPSSLQSIDCNGNSLGTLPTLPSTLQNLTCEFCQLTSLPALPSTLTTLSCDNNLLTSLPTLPNGIQNVFCQSNQLTSLPSLPNTVVSIFCQGNQITCLPVMPSSIIYAYNLNVTGNLFTCVPNYIPAMDATTLALPLCAAGNPNGCAVGQGIVGFTYKDMNADCMKNAGDSGLRNIPLQIFANSVTGIFLGQTYSGANGVYEFPQINGVYTILVDTASPFKPQCTSPGYDTTVTTTTLDTAVNFSLICKPGFDVGVQSAIVNGLVFPGQQHSLSVLAGDLSNWYNLNCAAGTSGQVQISINGPVTYVSPAVGALTPSIAGSVYTYTIADFGTLNMATAFNLILKTDTTAQASDTICVHINVTPTSGDNNVNNNTYSFCYGIVNSHDPNHKETYPVNVLAGYADWFTYTIHFQNTGTASAINIRLADTLDANLDPTTFQVINYSHKNTAMLNNNVVAFSFRNINLPDSISNPTGSIGFVQYRVKPKTNLPAGTQIKNTAYIYFDYNAPVVTNTSLNNYMSTLGIKNNSIQTNILVYPNPANGSFVVEPNSTQKQTLQIIDVTGKLVLTQTINGKTTIDASTMAQGVYNISITNSNGVVNKRLVIVK